MESEKIKKPFKTLEKLDISDQYERRLILKSLYDSLMRAILFICTKYFGWREEVIIPQSLNSRWQWIKNALIVVGTEIYSESELEKWDKFIKEINSIRNKVEHNDLYSPPQKNLEKLVHESPNFLKWIIPVSREYFKVSSNFTFKQRFYLEFDYYIRRAEYFLEVFGESPYLIKEDFTLNEEYSHMKKIVENHAEILEKLKREDVNQNDLETLIKLVELVNRADVAESSCLSKNKCPKCGSKIVESTHYVGSSEDLPEPYAVVYRVGCEKCDYVLHKETFNI
jgi:ribosomal protein S27AE